MFRRAPGVEQTAATARGDSGYRPDIDGLRAVAVVSVVLGHAFPGMFPGGFVGVDVFFVISGYLITGILARELREGTYSLAGFYDRRVRRILPALLVCVAVTGLVGACLLPPREMTTLAESAASVAMLASNLFFWKTGGYFGLLADDQPLLHTWSLGVEEQFYLLWPLVLALFLKAAPLRRFLPAVLGLIVAASLAASIAFLERDQGAVFYLLPTRAWELGLGAALALGMLPAIRPRWARELVGLAGLAAIAVAVRAYSYNTPFPGLAALLPCVGALFLIWAGGGRETWTARALSLPPVVFVGAISYSFYLWHWPALTFGHILANRELTHLERGGLIAVAAVLAVLSWRYVERPFRRHGRQPHAWRVVAAGVASLAAVGLSAGAVAAAGGVRGLADPRVHAAEAASADFDLVRGQCNLYRLDASEPVRDCVSGADGRAPYEVLLWGDSHADHFAEAWRDWAAARGLTVRQATKAACRPLLTEAADPDLGVARACLDLNRKVLEEIARQPRLRLVVLSGYWTRNQAAPTAADGVRFARTVGATLDQVRRAAPSGTVILVMGSSPNFNFSPAACIARARVRGTSEAACDLAPPRDADERATLDRLMAETVKTRPGTLFLEPWRALCGAGGCAAVKHGVILFHDAHHLSDHGGKVVLAELLKSAPKVETAVVAPR